MKPSDHLEKYIREFPALCDALGQFSPYLLPFKIPVLGKLFGRFISIKLAARISGVPVQELIRFISTRIGENCGCFAHDGRKIGFARAGWISRDSFQNLKEVILDVRPVIDKGADPFHDIMGALQKLGIDEYLALINYFEPVPLYYHLKENGFVFYAEKKGSFFEIKIVRRGEPAGVQNPDQDPGFFDIPEEKLEQMEQTLRKSEAAKIFDLDVSDLPAPEPLLKINEALTTKPGLLMLKVIHRKLPVHLPGFFKGKKYRVSAFQKKTHVTIYIFDKILLEGYYE